MPLITSFSTGSGGSYTFGWTPADVTSDTAGNIVSGVALTVWTTAARTEQVTELFDADGVTPLAGGVVRSDATGRYGFVASDAFTVLYVWAGSGAAWPVLAHEVLDSAATRSAEAVAAAETAQGNASAAQAAAQSAAADAATETAASLGSTYAAVSLGRPTARVGIVGDSFEIANQASVGWGNGWPILAMLKSAGRIQMVKNAAVAGTNMDHYLNTQMPALASEDVNTIIIGGAENDIQECVAAGNTVAQAMATLRARLDALVAAIHKRGAKPVLRTTAPHYYTTSHQFIVAWNQYVKNYGNLHGIPVADFYRVLVDPATGNYKSGYSQEALNAAIHPNATSTPLIAQEFIDKVATNIPANVPLSETSSDPGQLSVNPAFLTLSGAAGSVPTGWSSTAVTGVTRSSVTAAGIPGNLYRLAAVASAAISQINGAAGGATAIDATDAVAGDVLEWSQTVISDGGVAWTSQLAIYASSGNVYPGFSAIAGSGTFSFVRRIVVPAGMTLIQPQMFIAAGTGTVDFSHPSIRNLTREGIA